MTQDIVERLRSQFHLTQGDGLNALLATGDEAADLIEQLRADNERQAKRITELEAAERTWGDMATIDACENERLRENLREISDLHGEINPSNYDHDDVCELNRQFVYAIMLAKDALAAQQKEVG